MSAAEHRAEELMSMVRAGLAPHLARHLADKLVRELMAQRTALLQAHRAAEQEIGVVEARFTTLEKQLCQALDLHERRLRQLQADLAAKTEENRRLLQVLAAAPRPVEADKAAEPASLN
jgi:aminoglycoside N3'-acetyltransferase